MTSPSVDLDLAGVMPYGVTVEGKGNRNAEIVTESSFKNSNVALKLPDGPCRVVASWDGPEAVRLVHTGHGYPVVIPAGGGIARGWPRLAPLREKQSSCRTFLPHPSQAVAAEQSRCTHSRSSNRRGGGLNDHISRGFGRNFAVRDSLQDGLRVLHGRGAKPARFGRVFLATRRCVPNTARLHGARGRRGVVEARRIRRENNQNVRDSRRRLRGAPQLQTAHHPDRRGRAVVDYHDPAPERRRPIHLNRIATHLPTTQITTGVV